MCFFFHSLLNSFAWSFDRERIREPSKETSACLSFSFGFLFSSSAGPYIKAYLKDSLIASISLRTGTSSFSTFVNSMWLFTAGVWKLGNFSAKIFVKLNPMTCM